MGKIFEIIKKKPLFFFVISVGYALGVGVLKWGIPSAEFIPSEVEGLRGNAWLPAAALYITGALLGVYFLDGAEVFFRLKPSPFRSVVFMSLFAVVSFFIITSSGSVFASGLALSLYLSLLLWQIGEWRVMGSLHSWYRMVAGPVTVDNQRWILIVFVAIFFIETYLFIR